MSMPAAPTAVIAQITGQDLLARLDALSTGMQTLTVKLDDVPAKVHDHEIRLRVLEAARWKAVGAASLLSALLSGGIVTVVLEAVRR